MVFTSIKEIRKKYGHFIIDLSAEEMEIMLKVYNEDFNGLDIENDPSGFINKTLGTFYTDVKNDTKKMKKYYLKAIEKGNTRAMHNMGLYYDNKKKYSKMIHYYNMALDNGFFLAANNLGLYYRKNKECDKMKELYDKYEPKCTTGIISYSYGLYYESIKNYDKMKEYYLKAINKRFVQAMKSLATYYEKVECNSILAERYRRMAKGHYDIEDLIKYHNKGIKSDSREVVIFINKCNLMAKNNICMICYEEDIKCIPFECCHYACLDCYVELKTNTYECPQCRIKF